MDRCPTCNAALALPPVAGAACAAPTGGDHDFTETTVDHRCGACGEHLTLRVLADLAGGGAHVTGVRLGLHPEWSIEELRFSPSGRRLWVHAWGGPRIYRLDGEAWGLEAARPVGALLEWTPDERGVLTYWRARESYPTAHLCLADLGGAPRLEIPRPDCDPLAAALDAERGLVVFIVASSARPSRVSAVVHDLGSGETRVDELGTVLDGFAAIDAARRRVYLGGLRELTCWSGDERWRLAAGPTLSFPEGRWPRRVLVEPEGSVVLVSIHHAGPDAPWWLQRLHPPDLRAAAPPAQVPYGGGGFSKDMVQVGLSEEAVLVVSYEIRRLRRRDFRLVGMLHVDMDIAMSGRAAVAPRGELVACTRPRDVVVLDARRRCAVSLRGGTPVEVTLKR